MKKIIILLSLILTLALAGCGADEGEKNEVSDTGSLGDYEVAIKDYQILKDYEGNDAIAITYDFTNNSDEAISFDAACMHKVFQDGVELEYTSVYLDEESYKMADETSFTEIKSGKTLEVTTTDKLNDTTNSVEVEVEEFMGMDEKKLAKKFVLSQ